MKKSTSIIVNKQKYNLYKIKWLDIVGDAGHRSFEGLTNMQPASKTTFAFIFKKGNLLQQIMKILLLLVILDGKP